MILVLLFFLLCTFARRLFNSICLIFQLHKLSAEVECELVRGIVARGQHEPVEQLVDSEYVALLEEGRGASDFGGRLVDRDLLVERELELVRQLQHCVNSHDLGETGDLPAFALHPPEQHVLRLPIVDHPGEGAHGRCWLVHQDLGELDLRAREVRQVRRVLLILLVGVLVLLGLQFFT